MKGPSLGASLTVLVGGLVLGVASLFFIVTTFVDSLDGTRFAVPGGVELDLEGGEWVLYERVDFGFFANIRPADVRIEGPEIVVPRSSGLSETLTVNGREYVDVARFDVDEPGTYRVIVGGERTSSGEALVSRPITHVFTAWPWFVAGGLAGLAAIAGTVLLILGIVNRKRASAAGLTG